MRRFGRKKHDYANISMLNLIDVIFILLIFFMLTTTFKKYWQFEIDLPAAAAAKQPHKELRCEVAIDAAGANWWLDGAIKRPLDALAFAALRECEQVQLSAHKELAYERVVGLISALNEAQIKEIQLNIERK